MKLNIYEDNIGFVEYVDHLGNDQRAAASARVSFDKFNTEDELSNRDLKLIRFLAKENHTSPFEHSFFSVKIKCPLFIRSQIMRHRTFSYNEVSRRYTSENIEMYIPSVYRKQSSKNLQCSEGFFEDVESLEVNRVYATLIERSLKAYNTLLEMGVSREQARGILPNATYTSFIMSGNLLNWMKFLRLRLDDHAQEECQVVAKACKTMIEQHFPKTIEVFSELGWF
jgi:thymidylate synthase (FAD)